MSRLLTETEDLIVAPTHVKRYPVPRLWVLGNLRETEIGDLRRVCGVDARR